MLPFMSRTLPRLALIAALSGCSALSAINGASQPLQTYELRAPDAVPQARRERDMILIVEKPETSGALNTNAILIRPDARQASYLPDGEWSEDLPIMVQTLLLRTMQGTGGYNYVGREPLGLNGDYALLSELIDFQAEIDATSLATQAQVTLLIRIIREADTRIIASKRFTITAPATDDSAEAITAAFEAGLGRLLPQIADWVMARTGVATR